MLSLLLADSVILAPEWQHQGLSSYLRTRKSGPVKDALPGEVVKQEFAMRVDLQELDEDNQSESENLRAWSEKNPYKVGPECINGQYQTDQLV